MTPVDDIRSKMYSKSSRYFAPRILDIYGIELSGELNDIVCIGTCSMCSSIGNCSMSSK